MASDIQLTVGLEAGEVTDTAEELRGKIESIFEATAGKEVSTSFMNLQNSMNKAYQTSAKLQQQLEALGNSSFSTDEYSELQNNLLNLQEEFVRLKQEKQKMIDAGVSEELIPDTMKQELITVEESIKEIKAQLQQLESSGEGVTLGTDTQEYQDLVDKLANANNQMTILVRKSEEAGEIPAPESKWRGLRDIIGGLGNDFGSVANSIKRIALTGLHQGLSLAINGAKNLASNLLHLGSNAIKSGFSGLLNVTKKLGAELAKLAGTGLKRGISSLAGAVFGIKKSSDSVNDSVKQGIKTFIKYAFGVRSFFFLYKKIRAAITEGFGNLAQYSGPLNAQVSQLVTTFNYLKNSITAAFAPIASFVIPILNTLMNALAQVANAVGQFMASLLGSTSFIKAKKVYKDYASSLSKSSGQQQKNASKTQKKVEKLQKTIAGFDDVQILQNPNKNDDSGSPSGGGGGGGGGAAWEDPNNMFETVKVEDKFKALADKIKGFFKSKDWEGLGKFMADGINAGFKKLDAIFTSSKLKEKIHNFVNAITRTFNSLVSNIDWKLIGKTFGDGINLIVDTLNQLYTGINWYNLGSSIAVGLNSLVNTINWTALGQLFANKFNAIIDFLAGAILTFDWAKLGTSLGEAINGFFLKVNWSGLTISFASLVNGVFSSLNNISKTVDWKKIGKTLGTALSKMIQKLDWAGIAKSLSTFLSGALSTLISAVQAFDWQKLGDGIGTFLVNINWLSILLKLIKAIALVLTGLVQTAVALIGKVFTTIFTKVSEEVKGKSGEEIIQGLFDGIVNALKNVGAWMVKNVFKPIIDAFKKAFGISSPSKKMKEQGGYVIEGLLKGITDALKNISSWIKTNIFDKILNALKKAFGISGTVANGIKTIGSSIISGIQNGATTAWTTLQTYVSGLPGKIKDAITKSFGSKFTDIGKSVLSGIKSGLGFITELIKTAGGLPEKIKTAIKDNFGSKFTDRGKAVLSGIKSGLGAVKDLKDTAGKLPGKIKDAIKDNFGSKFTDIGSSIVSGIKSGISNAWDSFKKWFGDKTSGLAKTGKNAIKSKSPSKLFRDEVGKPIPQGIAVGIDKASSEAVNSIEDLSSQLTSAATQSISLPSIVGGKVIPYSIGKINTDDTNNTLNQVLDMLQYNKDNSVSMDELQFILTDLFSRFMNIQFYLGDEQIARHANAGNLQLNRRYNTTI